MKEPVREWLDEAGYSNGETDEGFDCADTEGWSTFDEPGQFRSALSGFPDDDEPADEDLAPWEPVGWDDD